jgi:DNA-binding transcriptional LysR family regulator
MIPSGGEVLSETRIANASRPSRTAAPSIRAYARDWTAKLGLAVAGLGITIVPGLAVPILPPSLAVIRIDHPAATRSTAMVTRSDAPDDPDRHALLEAPRDSAAEIAADVRRQLRA